jgi:hypothetical protein
MLQVSLTAETKMVNALPASNEKLEFYPWSVIMGLHDSWNKQ